MFQSQDQPANSEHIEPRLVDATAAAITRWGLTETTRERIAVEAGISRATMYRSGVTRDQLVAALTARAAQTFRTAIWPALTGRGSAAERLRAALEAMCAAAEQHLPLLAGMFSAEGEVFHRPGPNALTVDVFAEPFERLLLDGAADGTLRRIPETVTATVLFNMVGWGYIHLRSSHHWEPEIACRSVIDLALHGLLNMEGRPSQAV
ncbi:TetR/AcrR family transcriptional regulator [Mycobacterium gastri]|uniref:TetR family transcriptional regulator n=1 Tax=Mycobacterium gastri TaxID=1777 RepID=A0A1X1V8V0_MYCGS|nr:TetR/AcrR family transcriptional regulator [Mycobacterium gastri]ETW24082.1 TetR family transcriptional regulator [Mycobacterium gastri 'Wayne']ORV65493.1 TetR family transcriptional regulator [Mycobacterium gastri]